MQVASRGFEKTGGNMGPPIQVIAKIEIALTPEGRVLCSANGAISRPTFNMMMETAKQDIVAQMLEKERSPLVIPDPTLIGRNGNQG